MMRIPEGRQGTEKIRNSNHWDFPKINNRWQTVSPGSSHDAKYDDQISHIQTRQKSKTKIIYEKKPEKVKAP